MYIASVDALKAYNDIAPAVEQLLKLNAGIDCKVQAETEFDEFIKMHSLTSVGAERPSVYQTQRYAVYAQ